MSSHPPALQGASLLRSSAYVVVVVAGLRAASAVLVPIVSAAVLALVFLRPMRFLRERGLPPWVAALVVAAGATAMSVLLSAGFLRSVTQFTAAIPTYQQRLLEIERDVVRRLPDWAKPRHPQPSTEAPAPLDGSEGMAETVPPPSDATSEPRPLLSLFGIEPGGILSFFSQLANAFLGILQSLFVILLVLLFMLLEANDVPEKLRQAFGDRVDVALVQEVGDKVFSYLWLKTVVSMLTGACVYALTSSLGLDFPALWALVAFLFNFVPTIGSIVAAVPAVLLGLVQEGWGLAALVAVGYLMINVALGNLLEPRLMGRRLGLSTLVVFVSLLFWNWVWGPVGMLLSIPITMVTKIVLEHTDDYRFVAVLLGPSPHGRS